MEKFLTIRKNDIVIEAVNLYKATKTESEEFKNKIKSHVDTGVTKIIVDLHQCEFVDSTFLSALLIAFKAVQENDGELKLVAPKNEVDSIIELTGMKKVFEIYFNLAEAIESFN